MEKLHVSFMRDLLNIEFEGLYFDIIKLMEIKQVDDSNINIAFERVKPHVEKFDALRNRQRHPLSTLNKKLTRMRTDYLISLRLRVESYMRSHIPEERVAAERIYFVMDMYGKKYYVPSIITQSAFVDDLVANIKEHKDFKDAFTLLRLHDLMDTIAEMTEEIMKNYLQRVNDNSRRKERNKGVRMAAYKDMKVMIDAINFMYVLKRDDEDMKVALEDLMWHIKETFKAYSTPMKSRTTKRKNRRAVANAVKELIDMQQNPQKMLPVGVNQELKTENEEVSKQSLTSPQTSDPKSERNDRSQSETDNQVNNKKRKGKKGGDEEWSSSDN